jgi:hypothetical protein
LKAAKGGFSLREKPLECLLSVYSNSENAIAGQKEKLNIERSETIFQNKNARGKGLTYEINREQLRYV